MAPDRDTGRADRIRVVHVDDDPAFAELTAAALAQEGGFEVTSVGSAAAALAALDEAAADCVVSDYEMPGTDGLALLEAVRADHPELPFVLFTGRGSEALASRASAAGVTDYLRKDGRDTFTRLAARIRLAVTVAVDVR